MMLRATIIRRLFLIWGLFCSPSLFFAQTTYVLPQPGAVYTEVYFQESSLQYEPKNFSLAYTGDTLVGPYTYAQLEFYPIGSSVEHCTYYDNGRIYYHDSVPSASNPAGGMLLYDFNLGLGDTFYYPVAFNYWFYNQFPFIVDSVSTITLLNAQVRKYIRLTDGQYVMEWVDGIGDINNGFFYIYAMTMDRERLVCVNDSSGAVYIADPDFYCDPFDPIPSQGPNTCDVFSFDANIYYQSCNGCDGVISIINLTGGVPPYTYTWSSMGSGSFETDICLGQEIVTIHDANGNSCARSYYMGWNLPAATYVVDPYPCDGVDTVTIIPLSGISPFTALWYPQGVWAMSQIIDSSGQYWVSVRDNAFCGIQIPVDITNVELLQASTQAASISCASCCDGDIVFNITGGHPPFTVTGTPALPAANNYCQGWYQYCVTDSLGCMYCDSVYVPGVTGMAEEQTAGFRMFPNPAGDVFTIQRETNAAALLFIRDVNGRVVREVKITNARTTIDIADLAAGIYTVELGNFREQLVIIHNE